MKNYQPTRREFLGEMSRVVGGLGLGLLGIDASAVKSFEDSKTTKIVSEELKRMREKNHQQRLLSYALDLDYIFESARPGEDYIAEVVERAEPGLIIASKKYFTNEKDLTLFLRDCEKQDKVFGWRYRHSREIYFA